MSEIEPPRPPEPGFVPTPAQPAFEKNRQYKIERDFTPLLLGEALLPSFELIPHHRALIASMGYGRTVERVQVPGKTWDQQAKAHVEINVGADKPVKRLGTAIYYLNCGQGGGFTGEGTVVLHWGYAYEPGNVITGKFTFCKHEKVESAGANHERGWHPGFCKLCGLDMSVDSGD